MLGKLDAGGGQEPDQWPHDDLLKGDAEDVYCG
jgi:hypothetical protein